MEEEVKLLIAAGFSDEEIAEYLESKEPSLRKDIHGGSASFLQGASLGLGGMIDPGMKEASDQFNAEHKILGPVTNLAGTVAGGMMLPVSLGARVLTRALTGAGAAAVQGATSGEKPSEVARDAAIGAGAGVALPWLGGKIVRGAQRAFAPYKSAATQVAEGAGPLLPKDAVARMAAQEALAPGTATPVSVSPGMAKSVRNIGSNAPLATEAAEAAQSRVVKLQTAMNAVSSDYEQLLAGKVAPLNLGQQQPNIQPLAMKYGIMPGQNGDVGLPVIQKLRSALRVKLETTKGMPRAELKKDIGSLSKWLEANEPEVAKLDQKWGILSGGKRAEDKVIKNLAAGREGIGASRVAGVEPGTPAGSIPLSKSSILQRVFGPDRSRLAEEANRLLLQPGQIPQEMLKARARSASRYQPSLWAPFVLGGQAPEVTGLFD